MIALPRYGFEGQLADLIDKLGEGDDVAEVRLNFQAVEFWTPGALVLLLAKIDRWLVQGKSVYLENCKACRAFKYLQRINFFSQIGIDLPEDFSRQDAGGRFLELQRIGGAGSADVAQLSSDIAYCLFPDADVDDPEESGLFDVLEYSVSELINNVRQHAKAPGFVMAQFTAKNDLIRVGIADRGIGVLRSFSEAGSPLWTPTMTDIESISLALQPKISSKLHLTTPWGESVNAGVGLTLLKEICTITSGPFFMASGNGAMLFPSNGGHTPRQISKGFQGTVCSLAFKRLNIRTFPELLNKAKQATGLLPQGENFGKFFS
jgi:anti-sigma regulatory factor (Ser/Thr protein kinase)